MGGRDCCKIENGCINISWPLWKKAIAFFLPCDLGRGLEFWYPRNKTDDDLKWIRDYLEQPPKHIEEWFKHLSVLSYLSKALLFYLFGAFISKRRTLCRSASRIRRLRRLDSSDRRLVLRGLRSPLPAPNEPHRIGHVTVAAVVYLKWTYTLPLQKDILRIRPAKYGQYNPHYIYK